MALTSEVRKMQGRTLAASNAMPSLRGQVSCAARLASLRAVCRMLYTEPREHHSMTSSGGCRQMPIQSTMLGCRMEAWMPACSNEAAQSLPAVPAAGRWIEHVPLLCCACACTLAHARARAQSQTHTDTRAPDTTQADACK